MPETEMKDGAATAVETGPNAAEEARVLSMLDEAEAQGLYVEVADDASPDQVKAAIAAARDAGDSKNDDGLAAAGKAAIAREREARKKAERDARDLKKRLDAIDAEKLTETEKLQKQADEGKAAAATATDKLRKANLITALAENGIAGAAAKVATRLLDGVEFDDDDEPTNLTDALKAAKTAYGEHVFAAPAATASDAQKDDKQESPELHGGVRQTDEGAKPEGTGLFDHKFKKTE